MNTRTNLGELYKIIHKDASKIPPFINTKSDEHHTAYLVLSDLISYLSNLVQPRVLSDKELWKHLIEFEEIALGFCMIESMPLFLTIEAYLSKRISLYESWAIEYDEFETAANLKKFYDMRQNYSTI